ncbi:hypothetical protein J5X84_36115 [Streptosporangiaceae bacterium NEAU-GS5]|nr:hypothetical protein [Streptosporangiaceae bacterium NEAU-GS5]
MAKEGGLGWSVASVDDAAGSAKAIRNDFTSVQFQTPRAVWDVTGLDKSAIERILLLADMSVDFDGVFNDATDRAHDVFKTVPSTSVNRTVTLTVSGQTLACECLFTDYSLNRSDSGELTFKAPGVLADGAVPTWA